MSEIKEVKRSALLSLLALAMLFGFCFGAELKMVVVVLNGIQQGLSKNNLGEQQSCEPSMIRIEEEKKKCNQQSN
ncbi:hypothetical protein CFP56_032194 [Quercus suber]|uniref:Uncharacterized protein n=1 Tax=Quercus suber TaxID=58331 RepID=A0AAW0JI68_QUESU